MRVEGRVVTRNGKHDQNEVARQSSFKAYLFCLFMTATAVNPHTIRRR